jgi:glycosyltransferase involved in cell wall biosynthesis
MPIRYVSEPEPGLHAGRHRGAREARGEVVAYLDDDTQVHEDWLRGAEPVLRGLADAVACRILPQWEAPVTSWLEDLVSTGVYGPLTLLDLGEEQREVEPEFVWGAGFFIRRSLVFDLNGFHPDSMPAELLRFRGDGESGLMRKFAAAGHRAWYDPSSVVEHAMSTKRMTHLYLRERFYRQGISDSFAELRAELLSRVDLGPAAGLAESPRPAARTQPRVAPEGLLHVTPRRMAGGIRRGRAWASRNLTASRRSRLRFDEDMRRAALRGRDFHRRAAESDTGVMAWVRLPHYIDVSLSDFSSFAGPLDSHDVTRPEG